MIIYDSWHDSWFVLSLLTGGASTAAPADPGAVREAQEQEESGEKQQKENSLSDLQHLVILGWVLSCMYDSN